jgi:hypothetical protein
MKVRWRLVLGFLVSILALAACSPVPDEEDLVLNATALAIPGPQRSVTVISDIQRTSQRVTWKALTPQGEYDCSANQYFAWPTCVRS